MGAIKKISILLCISLIFFCGCNFNHVIDDPMDVTESHPAQETEKTYDSPPEEVVFGDFVLYRDCYLVSHFPATFVYLDSYTLGRYEGSETQPILPEIAPDGLPILAIGKWCFTECNSLEKIVIPDGYLTVMAWSFQRCPNLKELYIGKGIVDFTDVESFSYCNQLSIISVHDQNPVYKSVNNCLLTKDGKKLIAGCKSSIIPDTVEEIGQCAFIGRETLTNITIPSSVKIIGDWAFRSCTGLKEVYLSSTVTQVGYRAFHDCPILTVRCEAPERPAGWHEGWDGRNLGETTDRYPVPNVIWGAEPVS